MTELINALSVLSLIEWSLISVIWVIIHFVIYFTFAKWILKGQWKLYKNLKRPIIILTPTASGASIAGGDMRDEIHLLKSNGLLNVSSNKYSYRNFNPAGKHCIVVMGYKPGMEGMEEIVNLIRTNHVPLIVYTYGQSLPSGPDKTILDSYSYTLYANFSMTLLSHIFSTVACFPYEME